MSETNNANALAREMTASQKLLMRPRSWLAALRRTLPHLVWYGDELDIRVTFTEPALNAHDPLGSLRSGPLAEIEAKLATLGVEFDKGVGPDGHDWEWDWSLRGPIRITFRGPASEPERRARAAPRMAAQFEA